MPVLHLGARTRLLLLTTILALTAPGYGSGAELTIGSFASAGLRDWEVKKFKGATEYTVVEDHGTTVVKAVSHASASGLIKKISFDPQKYRYLRWSWKIGNLINGGDETSKAGDDYPVRLYILFPGRFFWQTRAINYVWANKLKKGASFPNPFTANAMMLVVESGAGNKGKWVSEERDIVADYRQLFGSEPNEAKAIAIMTDSDNSGSSAIAWYGDITLQSEP